MKYVKFLALTVLAVAAISGLNACSGHAETSSSGTSAHVSTTSSK